MAALTTVSPWRIPIGDGGRFIHQSPTYAMVAAGGAYALTGKPAVMERSRRMPAAGGVYAYTGKTVGMIAQPPMVLLAEGGQYVYRGETVLLRPAGKPEAGLYALYGQEINLFWKRDMPQAQGSGKTRSWRRVDLVGARNGQNKTFTIPNFSPTETSWIIFNGRVLYETNLTPATTEEYRPSGATVVLGLAPDAASDLWAVLASEAVIIGVYGTLDLMVSSQPLGAAEVYAQEFRKTFFYQVYVRNKLGQLVDVIEEDISNISWTYSPVGGCLEAQLTLRRPFDDYGDMGVEYQVEIIRDVDPLGMGGARLPTQFGPLGIQLGTALSGTRELRWSGFVRELEPVLDMDENILVRCNGWSRQLELLVVANLDQSGNPIPYINKDVGEIVRDIIDTWVLAGSQIKRTPSFNLVPMTGITVGTIAFFTTASDALRTLAEIGGDCEWGVRADREFYFIQRNRVCKQTHVIADRVTLYRPLFSADDIVNRAYVQGSNARATINLSAYDSGYQKERVLSVGAISTSQAAALWAQGYSAKFAPGMFTPAGRLQLAATDDWIENVGQPSGLLRVIGGPVFVAGGDRLQTQLPVRLGAMYGKYTDEVFRINAITYRPAGDSLEIDVDLGARGNTLADRFKSIEYKLSELRQAQQ